MINHILFGLFVFVGAILSHEIGHIIYFKKYLKRDVKLYLGWKPFNVNGRWGWFKLPSPYVGTPTDYKGVSDEQLMNLYLWGILAGAVVVLFVTIMVNYLYIILFIVYMQGCKSDMGNLIELARKRTKELKRVVKG